MTVEEMKAVIDKLPKTGDGHPIYPGMKLWCIPLVEALGYSPRECIVDMICSDVINHQPEDTHVYIDSPPNYGGYSPSDLLFVEHGAAYECAKWMSTSTGDIPTFRVGKENGDGRHDATPKEDLSSGGGPKPTSSKNSGNARDN